MEGERREAEERQERGRGQRNGEEEEDDRAVHHLDPLWRPWAAVTNEKLL